jgi:periplasmic protein TonB
MMRIDRYVHDERLTWGAAGVLLFVSAIHAAGIGRLLLLQPDVNHEVRAPVFEVSLQKLPPPRLPQELERTPPKPNEAPPDTERQKPRLTRPVPILVDTPTTDPVPPDTQVKQYEIGDELLPGVPGPPAPEGTLDGAGTDAAPDPVFVKLKPVEIVQPVYPPRCRRMGVEGIVRVRVLVGENGRPREVTLGRSSGDELLDEAAIDAVRRWRFEPARRDGAPMAAWAVVPIEFKLVD